MEPRLSTSKKWSALPQDLHKLMIEVLTENLSAPARKSFGSGHWIVEGQVFEKEMLLRVGYLPKGSLKQTNFEFSLGLGGKSLELIHLALDAAEALFIEFFAAAEEDNDEDLVEEKMDLPRTWKSFRYNGQEVWVQYSTVNSELEQKANDLLGLAEDSLVKGSDETR